MTDEQYLVIATLLMEIRDALLGPADDESDVCGHPENHRVSLATPARPDHWVCNICRYEHGGLSQQ